MHRTIPAILVCIATCVPALAELRIATSGSTDPSGTLVGVVVKDEAGQPVEGANVTFTFPAFGPSAKFSNEDRSIMTTTNSYGRAVARAIRRESAAGPYFLKVSAWHGKENGSLYLPQENVAPEPKKSWFSGRRFGFIAAGAGAVILGTALLTRSSTPSGTTAGSVSPASPTVGGPR